MSCPTCDEFAADVRIDRATLLQDILAAAASAVERGRLVVDDRSLDWGDLVQCDLRCTACRQRFELSAETYHGAGGRWHVITEDH